MVQLTSVLSGLWGAIQFLTRVPLRLSHAVEHRRVVPWFPLVGALIGAAVGGVAAGATHLVPATVAAGLAVTAGLLITGAFHEDGLADVADAFGGGTTRERRSAILKDPLHGTYGVAALATSITLRVVTVGSIGSPAAMFAGFVAAHAIGRTLAVVAMATLPTATDSGLAADHSDRLRLPSVVLGVALGLALAVTVAGWWILPILGVSIVGAGCTCVLALRKIGGLNGDVLGAVEQVSECLALVVVSGLTSRYALWWA